ncbi:MAG: HEAT repeat domain-containing protein [Bacteroidota bacterium]
MNSEIKATLLSAYREQKGELSSSQEEMLERYIEQGWISLEELEDLDLLHKKIGKLLDSSLSSPDFPSMPNWDITQQSSSGLGSPKRIWYSLAAAIAFLLLGIGIGSWVRPSPATNEQIASLSGELKEMRELLTLSMLEKNSPSERLKAVYLTQEMPRVSDKVTTALLHTLHQDPNVNVRLVTLEILLEYANDPVVREGLIKAIPFQDSPLVQLAIAEAMVALQEKSSVQALEALLDRDMTPSEVKVELRKSIEILM